MTVTSVLDIDAVADATQSQRLVAAILAESGERRVDDLADLLNVRWETARKAVRVFEDADLVRIDREPTEGSGRNKAVAVPIHELAPTNHGDGHDKPLRRQVIEALARTHYEREVSTRTVASLSNDIDETPQQISAVLQRLNRDGVVVQYGDSKRRLRWALAAPEDVAPYRVSPTESLQ